MKTHKWFRGIGTHHFMVISVGLFFAAQVTAQQSDDIIVFGDASVRQVYKIALSGFTGEIYAALKFDLEVAGCANVTPDQAQYLVSGSNTDHVVGLVTDRLNKTILLSRKYEGANLRAEAHAFADEIASQVLHRKGIAQTKIAFKVMTGQTSEIYVADYDGHNAIAVTKDRSIVAAPCWVPGRRAIYYTSYRLGNPDVYFQDLTTGERKVIARYSGLNTSATVSPDGRRIALIMSKGGSPDLYVANADGSNLKQLTDTKEDESSPCWSPDGRTLCFTSRVSGRAVLYTIPVEGGTMRRMSTSGMAINTTEPDWSPDGKLVAYTAQMGGFQICVTEVSTGRTQVGLAAGEDPSWAPNSRTLIFTHRSRGKRTLSLLDVPSKQVKDIAQISGNCSQPSWAK